MRLCEYTRYSVLYGYEYEYGYALARRRPASSDVREMAFGPEVGVRVHCGRCRWTVSGTGHVRHWRGVPRHTIACNAEPRVRLACREPERSGAVLEAPGLRLRLARHRPLHAAGCACVRGHDVRLARNLLAAARPSAALHPRVAH